MTDRRLFYVTGMHRSGTSALTRVINLLGASVGSAENLMLPQADNPTGFWEVRAVAQLNEQILASHGGSWWTPPPGSVTGPIPASAGWVEKMEDILDGLRASGPGPYVLKDPRFAWTMPLWESVAPPDVVVVSLRAPEQVCSSLYRRNAIEQEDGAALWLEYVTHAMSTKHHRIVVDYGHLLGTTEDTVRGIADALGLPEPTPTTWQRVREFLDPGLDHADLSPDEPRGKNLEAARRVYGSLTEESGSLLRLEARNARP